MTQSINQPPGKSDQAELNHVSGDDSARMVDVAAKPVTHRVAVAEGRVDVGPVIAERMRHGGSVGKGPVLETARLAGIMGAKRTAELIPLCHPMGLNVVHVEAELSGQCVKILARAESHGKTGVEMEALTAASVAALTVYDMVKSADKRVEIHSVRLREKHGGKSGSWYREEPGHGSS
ncbi:MAG: cyclic pyranopterin monophosphate synthase MoaC [Pirellulales bacterium]